jgi:hypothetical protein
MTKYLPKLSQGPTIGSAQAKLVDQLSNQLQQFSIQQIAASQTSSLDAPPIQTSDVHSVQSMKPKAIQHPKGKKKQQKKGKGDKKPTNNVGGGNTERKKSKYPCNLYVEDHPTHLFPRLAEAQKLLVHQ